MRNIKKYKILICISIFIILFGLNVYAVEFNFWNSSNNETIEDKNACIIVKYKPECTDKVSFESIKARESLSNNIELIELSEPEKMELFINEIEENENVEFAQPNYLLRANELSDDYYTYQWGLKNDNSDHGLDINIEPAWEITHGDAAVTVGVLDTGINYKHPDLLGKIRDDGYNFIDNNNNIYDEENDKHGTAIAGIISSKDDGKGICGIASNVNILPLKFMNSYKGYTSDAVKAIDYAKNKDIKIINCSFSCEEYNPILKETMEDSSILFVCSAGNNSENTNVNPLYPASYDLPNVISVGSINGEGKLSYFSNYGNGVDVLAPGEEIKSTSTGEDYYLYSGTSLSAAYVTGVAALIKSSNHEMTATDISEKIKNNVRKFIDYEGKVKSGGIVDAYACISDEIAPVSDAVLFSEEENERFISNEASVEAVSDETSTFSEGGEIEPIIAQGVHYGESGVNPASGNFSFSVVDFNDYSPGENFIFERFYNSLDQNSENVFGAGWSSMLDSKINKLNGSAYNKLSVVMPNGSTNIFTSDTNGEYSSQTTRNSLVKDSDTQFTLTTQEQKQYIYNSRTNGNKFKLTEIKDKTGNTVVKIVYDKDYYFVSYILDSANRKYMVNYNTNNKPAYQIASIIDPYGRAVYYTYVQSTSTMSVTLYSYTDIMGNSTYFEYSYKNNVITSDGNIPDTDIFIKRIRQHTGNINNSDVILFVEYNLNSYDPDYGKVMSYRDAYGETYTFRYRYMKTIIDRENDSVQRREYYDSYMYTYKTELPVKTSAVTERQYYRPNGKNYGEVVQECSASGDSYGNITTYIRDENTGNITETINPDGSSKFFWYDNKNNVIGSVDEENNCTLFVYNDKNLLTKKASYLDKGFPNISDKSLINEYISQNPTKFIVESYVYADDSKYGCPYTSLIEQVIDGEGNITSYSYDKYGNIITASKPYKPGEEILFDTFERRVDYIDTNDVSAGMHSIEYSSLLDESKDNKFVIGFESSTTSPLGVSVKSYIDNNGNTYKTVKSDTENHEQVSRDVYDLLGRKIKEISVSAYAENNCSSYESVANFRINFDGIMLTYYYANFEKLLGNYDYATEYEYNDTIGAGYNEIKTIKYPEIDGQRDVMKYSYKKNNIIWQCTPDGEIYTYDYDCLDRNTSKSYEFTDKNSGEIKSLSLNHVERELDENKIYCDKSKIISKFVRSEKNNTLDNYFYNDKNLYNYRGDVIENVKDTKSDPSNNTKNIYNKNGTISKSFNSSGNITYYLYDNLNRPVEIWEAIDVSNNSTYFRYTKKEYYNNGNVKKEYVCSQPVSIPLDNNENVLPSDTEYRQLYNKEGQAVLASDFIINEYSYFSNGNVKSVAASNGSVTAYEYDKDGNLVKENKNGNIITYENKYFGTPTRKNEYVKKDSLELSDNDNYEIEGDYAILTTEYVYQNGNLAEITLPNRSSIKYEYDGLDRKISTASEGSFVNHSGKTVNGIYKESQKLDWQDNLKESVSEEIVGGNSTIISKTIYSQRKDAYKYIKSVLGYYYLFEQKVENISYEGAKETKNTALYYLDITGKVLMEISPENYSDDGVVSYETLYLDEFSDNPNEMNRTEYDYDILGRLTKVIERYKDPNDNYAWKKVIKNTYKYDKNSNIVEKTDALGNSTRYVYNLDNKLFMEKDPVAQENKYSYSKKYSYDALGRVVVETDSAKHDTVYTYEDNQNTAVQSTVVTQPDGTQKTVESHNKYDLNKNLVETYLNTPDRKYIYKYNERNQLTESYSPHDETAPESNVTIKYDALGNMTRKTIGTERLEIYGYDKLGNNISATVSKQDGTEAITTQNLYDSRGNVRFEMDGNTGDKQNVVEHKYDGFNREIETVDIHSTKYTYDKNGNIKTETDWRGNTLSYEYDPLNRLIKKKDANETVIEKLYYNDNDLQIRSDDALNNQTTYEYDKNNRLISTMDPVVSVTGQTYNRAGQISSKYDGKGNTTYYEYDELGRLITTSQNVEGVLETNRYAYDLFGNLETQTNGEGHTTTFQYNIRNEMTAKIDHGGIGIASKTESYKYDERGNVIEKTDRNGVTLSFVYDVHDRLTDTKLGDNVLIHNTYDGANNKLTMQDESGTTTRTYDKLGRVLTKDVPGIGTTTYQYDITPLINNGEVSEKTVDPKKNVTIKTYDNNRLHTVKDAENAEPTTYEYYLNGAQNKITNADGSKAEFEYNNDGTLSSIVNKTSADTIISSYSYAYDKAKNLIYKEETESGADKGATKYTYDEANRLKTVTEPSNKQTSYTYDKAGNRKTETVTESGIISLTTYNYNEQERLTDTVQTVGNTKKTVTYNYDNNGNIHSKFQGVEKSDDGEETELEIKLLGLDDDSEIGAVYEYDVFNRLVKTYQGSNVISNVYNGEGNRVSKTVNGNTCKYLYEYDKIVLETDGEGNQTARNVYGTNLITRESNDKKYTYHYNGHGDVTALTEKSGNIAAAYEYDSFGNITGETGDIENPYRYSGYEYDNETELYYLKSRFYDAETARFIQEDTYRGDASDPLSLNLYTYCANNPMTYVDWFGFFGEYNADDPFLVLYTAKGEERYNDKDNGYIKYTDENNEYINSSYTYEDMLALMTATGGNVNIVLQVRDAEYIEYDNSNNQQIKENMINDYAYLIKLAQRVIEEHPELSMPSFFLGTPEFSPTTDTSGDYATLVKDMVDGVVNKLGDDTIIGGLYYGRENPDDITTDTVSYSFMSKVSKYVHDDGGDLILIPYFTNEQEFTNVGYTINHGKYIDENGDHDLFDVAILQPGYYYSEIGVEQTDYFDQKLTDIYNSVLYRRVIVNNEEVGGAKTTNTIVGVEFEVDIGLVTGRWHNNGNNNGGPRGTLPEEKRARFAEYINRFYPLVTGQVDGYRRAFGIYAGGPNEMNLRNSSAFSNKVIGSNFDSVYFVPGDIDTNQPYNGLRFDEFSRYHGNIIFDILNGLFKNDWGFKNGESQLLNFLNNR